MKLNELLASIDRDVPITLIEQKRGTKKEYKGDNDYEQD